ncbi:MAG: DUF4335 domain-containing protein [Gloeocapsa sp. DLM2.Bin57]|nr:MAG: DUF4335 domain-containing protein [Gloeocapsa sp. DLM2.Bin57]
MATIASGLCYTPNYMSSLIKRYTPPTCTLKIFSNKWLFKPSTDNLSFELNIDDPRLPTNEQITIHGNYQQLQLLGITIEEYLQQFLLSSPLPNQNLLKHYLLCDLSPQPKIEVNISQLFDLANAISQCQQEIKQIKPRIPKIPLITGISAASLLIILKLLSSLSTGETTADTLITPTTSSDLTENEMIVTVEVSPPNLTEKPRPQLPSTRSDFQRLQPPDTVQSPQLDNQTSIPSGEIQPGDYQPLPPISPPTPPILPETFSTPTEIPSQVAISPTQEVQAYFQERWQPPQGLQEKLEYRLTFDSQGRIEQMIPIGRVSQYYLTQVKPPRQVRVLSNETITTDIIQIRLILTPQGLVQTFAEDS